MVNLRQLLQSSLYALPLLGLSLVVGAQEAGHVLLAIGQVSVQNKTGEKPLQQGAVLSVGDRIVTRQGAYAHVRMKDGGLLALRPDSELDIEVFDYDATDPAQGRVRYKLINGVSRSVTGAVGQANKKAFRLNTPVAAIGVRGTDFVTATTHEQTQVSVNQGAIVIAALGPQCIANSFGPCSSNSLPLAAGLNAGFAEVDIHNPTPRLRQDIENSPGQKTPAHPIEPLALLGDNLNLAPEVGINDQPTPMAAPTALYWGRWNAALQNVPGPTVQQLQALGQPIQLRNWLYGLGVNALPDNLPQTGRVSFTLAGGDVFLHTAAGQLQIARVLSGSLGINFGTAEFRVDSNIFAANEAYQLYAAGPVASGGYLRADPARSNAQIDSVLHADLKQAGSLLTKTLVDGSTLLGALAWRR